eukprot:14578418-Ditylum_brightwellii.AAC.1
MKQAFKQMKPITKGILGGAVNTLLVPNPVALSSPAIYDNAVDSLKFQHTKPFIELNDQDEIMSALVKRNKLHLHQAFDT